MEVFLNHPGGLDMKPVDAYRWLFTADADNSSEGIFEIQNVMGSARLWHISRECHDCLSIVQVVFRFNW